MTKLVEVKSMFEPDRLEISIWLTDICNYNCSYCFPGSKDGIYRYHKDVKFLVDRFNKLLSFYKDNYGKNKFFISICGGGEPTMYPYFYEFCTKVKDHHDVYFRLITNGSRTLRWWDENCGLLNEVMISFHSEFADPEHITNVADFLTEKNILTNVIVMMDASNWDKCVENIDYMKNNSRNEWIIEAKPIYASETHDENWYDPAQKEFVKNSIKRVGSDILLNNLDRLNPFKSIAIFSNGDVKPYKVNDYINNGYNSFRNWKCDVLNTELLITVEGKVHARCEKVPTDLNILSDDFLIRLKYFEPKKVLCPELICGITNNHHFSKARF